MQFSIAIRDRSSPRGRKERKKKENNPLIFIHTCGACFLDKGGHAWRIETFKSAVRKIQPDKSHETTRAEKKCLRRSREACAVNRKVIAHFSAVYCSVHVFDSDARLIDIACKDECPACILGGKASGRDKTPRVHLKTRARAFAFARNNESRGRLRFAELSTE